MTVATEVPWGPAPDGVDLVHWEGLREGELRIQRCSDCGTWIWGPQAICGECHGFDLGWERVEAVGAVYSWTRSWYPYIEELGDRLPYISVLVELPHAGGRRVLGILDDDPARTPVIGEPLIGAVQRIDGQPWPLLRWTRRDSTEAAAGGIR